MTTFLRSAACAGAFVAAAVGTPAPAAVLIHSYDFAAAVTDSVGGQNGTLLNGAFIQDHALVTDGVNDYVEFADKIIPTSGSYSVAFWVNEVGRSGTFTAVISQGFSNGPAFYLGHNPSNAIRVADQNQATGIDFGPLATWMQYTLSVDALAGTKLYRDGSLLFSNANALPSTPNGSPTRFARQVAPFDEYFHGSIDDVRIYSGALSVVEAQTLFTEGRTVGAIPEPHTYALMLAGLGAVAWTSRRRSRKVA